MHFCAYNPQIALFFASNLKHAYQAFRCRTGVPRVKDKQYAPLESQMDLFDSSGVNNMLL